MAQPNKLENEIEIVSRLDLAFAKFLSQRTHLDTADKKAFESLVAFLSQQQHHGHTCVEITDADKRILLASGFACESPHSEPVAYPLIIEANRLYLQRYWSYENRLATRLRQISTITHAANNLDSLLDRYFGKQFDESDKQRQAATLACRQALCIITGGPGTGKTTAICKILAVLQELADKPLVTALCAPTGKAAMRLQEAIANNLATLNCPGSIKKQIPQTAITLHRLLGANPPSPYFKHSADNPLVYDLVVVDEASMVDLALMSKLVDALKPGAKLILLGDKDQLASVESGAVLADLIAGLPSNTVELVQSYRFDDGIKQLAAAINRQDPETAWVMLVGNDGTVEIIQQNNLFAYIIEQRKPFVSLVNMQAALHDIFNSFNQFQVLCSNRHGKNGALAINAVIEQGLFGRNQHGLTQWYPGRPVMVTQNTPALHLYNGDIGICLPDNEQGGSLMVFFQRPDGAVKKFLPARMPTCETVFAMTVHKAQGSEFEEVLIVLPETVNPVLSKELLYTAITRAKKKIKIAADKSVFTATITKKIGRLTGLSAKL